MYKQALKNMYKAATDESNQDLVAAALRAQGIDPNNLTSVPVASEDEQFRSNYFDHGYDTGSPYDSHAGWGSNGDDFNAQTHDGGITLRKNPDGSAFEILKEKEPGGLPTGEQALTMPGHNKRNALLAALANKGNYGALAALSAAGLGGLGGAAFGGNANERILNAITGAAGGAGAVGGARGAMELLEGNVDPLLAAGLGGVTGGIGSGALARLLAKTLMK